jgi:hypothetical protein
MEAPNTSGALDAVMSETPSKHERSLASKVSDFPDAKVDDGVGKVGEDSLDSVGLIRLPSLDANESINAPPKPAEPRA